MNAMKTYDYLATSRERLLGWVREVGDAGYERVFPMGMGTIGRTLSHMLVSEWWYIERIDAKPVLERSAWPFPAEGTIGRAELEAAWKGQEARSRAVVRAVRDWESPVQYVVTIDEGEKVRITASRGDIFTQLALHEVHHRAQVMAMLRQLGVAAQDIDYNTMVYKREKV